MGLTQVSTDGVKSNAINTAKIVNGSIQSEDIADNQITTDKILDGAVSLAKLPHGDTNNDGKFLRANNGADPSFETVSIPAGTTINNNADNRVITGSGTANTLEGEANLTFDSSSNGGSLSVSGTAEFQLNLKDSDSTGNAAETAIAFRDSGDTILGLVGYNYWGDGNLDITNNTSGQSICFQTGGSNERMRIDSSGNVGIGTSSPQRTLEVIGQLAVGNSSGAHWFFDRNDSNGLLEVTQSNGSGNDGVKMVISTDGKVGIGTTSPSNLLHVKGSGHDKVLVESSGTSHAVGMQITHASGDATEQVWQLQTHTGAATQMDLSIRDATAGSILATFRKGGGITFNGDSAAANALDDYEEGTFVPDFANVSNSDITVNYATYTKVGRLVHFECKFTVSSSDGSTFGFTLPFTQAGSRQTVIPAMSDRSGSTKPAFAFTINANQNYAYAHELEGFGTSGTSYNTFSGNTVLLSGTFESN